MNEMIVREYEGNQVHQQADGYISATEMARPFGKQPRDWLRQSHVRGLMEAITRKKGIPLIDLVRKRQGGGTWLHLAMQFAQWLNPEFAIAVSDWCIELATKGVVDIRPKAVLSPMEAMAAQIADQSREIADLRSKFELIGQAQLWKVRETINLHCRDASPELRKWAFDETRATVERCGNFPLVQLGPNLNADWQISTADLNILWYFIRQVKRLSNDPYLRLGKSIKEAIERKRLNGGDGMQNA